MKRLAACLLALVLCGCVARADGDTITEAATWYAHGIARTALGGPVGGGTVELWRGATLVARRDMPSQSFGITVSQTAGVYQVRYTPPAGWECVGAESAGVGWTYPAPCVGQIALPEQAPSLGPDLVFVLAYAATPPPIPTATALPPTVPPATAAPPQGTAVWPTDEPTRTPTAITPTATAPADGWARWQNPPQEVAAALMYEVEWYLDTLGPSRDPLQLAVMAEYGPALPLGGPMLTHYSIAGPNGTEVATAVRWQVWACARGWVVAWSLETEPYRVATMKGGW